MSQANQQTMLRRGGFVTTRWTLVTMAIDEPGKDQMAALEELCRQYHPAVVSYLKRLNTPSDAEDLAQQFFLHLLTKGLLKKVKEERGKFRRFLLTCLNNYTANEYQRKKAQKRGGHMTFTSADDWDLSEEQETPDKAFDRKWAETVLEQALKQVEEKWTREGKPFDALKEYLVSPKSATPIGRKAGELDISQAALKSSIYRLRQHYGAFVRAVIAETLGEHQNIEEELECLLAILGN